MGLLPSEYASSIQTVNYRGFHFFSICRETTSHNVSHATGRAAGPYPKGVSRRRAAVGVLLSGVPHPDPVLSQP